MIEKCETCGQIKERRWLPDGTPELADLTAFIQSLFDYQGEIYCATSPDGSPALDSAIGASRRYDQPAPIAELIGIMREKFQRAFGESNTGRKFWWREKPNILMGTDNWTRKIRYALWLGYAIEGLTTDELDQLNYVPEGASISWTK